jgi:hypothetical protein
MSVQMVLLQFVAGLAFCQLFRMVVARRQALIGGATRPFDFASLK